MAKTVSLPGVSLSENKGSFDSIDLAPTTGTEGDFIKVSDKTYTWDASSSTWKEVVVLEAPSSDSHDKGIFSTIYKVHQAYPAGGSDGDYVTIQGYKHYWNNSRGTWVVTQEREDYWDHQLGALSEQVGRIEEIGTAVAAYLNSGYLFAGVIGPLSTVTTNPVKVIYLAYDAGVYHNCGDIVVDEGTTAILKWNGTTWSKDSLAYAKAVDLKALKTEVDNIKASLVDILRTADTDIEPTEYDDF